MASSPSRADSWPGVRGPGVALALLAIGLCAVLMFKWLAVAGLVAVGLFAALRWVWRSSAGATGDSPAPRDPVEASPADDCTWCGLAGGHRDHRGRLLRPRNVHLTDRG